MKTKLTKFMAVILAVITAFGITAYAATNSKNIDIFYRNIKIMIDGAEYIAKDVNGNVVEPFIHNGTTYLPVRAIATAFGKDVIWDGANATVYLGKKDQNAPDNRLDKLQYTEYRESNNGSTMQLINGTITDFSGNDHTNGLLFGCYGSADSEKLVEIDYPLNGQYETLCGSVVLPKSYELSTGSNKKCDTAQTNVVIIGDDEEELFRINGVVASMPYKFEVDIKGVNKITIKVCPQAGQYGTYFVALTDLALYE